MKTNTWYVLLSLWLIWTGMTAVASESPEWEVSHQGDARGDVTTYVRDVEGSPVKAFRGVVELPADEVTILAALTTIELYPEWIFQNRSSAYHDMDAQTFIYMRFKGIWPVSDRDVVLQTDFQRRDDRSLFLHTTNVKSAGEVDGGVVRIPELDNQFVVTELGDGWSRVEFDTFVHPGGSVPLWLANLVAVRAPRETLEGLAEQVTLPRFANVDVAPLVELTGIDDLGSQ